jgi:hypothetical protein
MSKSKSKKQSAPAETRMQAIARKSKEEVAAKAEANKNNPDTSTSYTAETLCSAFLAFANIAGSSKLEATLDKDKNLITTNIPLDTPNRATGEARTVTVQVAAKDRIFVAVDPATRGGAQNTATFSDPKDVILCVKSLAEKKKLQPKL